MNIDKIQNTPKYNPQFGAVKLYSGSKEILKAVLKPEELKEAAELFEKRANDFGDTVFHSKNPNSQKLTAIVNSTNRYISSRELSQRFFESTIRFIRRVCKRAEDIQIKSDAMGSLNPDEILKKY